MVVVVDDKPGCPPLPPGGYGGERWATQPRDGEAGGDGDTHSTNEVQEIGDMSPSFIITIKFSIF